MNNTNTQTVAGLNSAQETLNKALVKVLAEFSPSCLQGATNLTWFSFLLDQTLEAAPSVHPMECALQLYLRLVPGDRKALADAFTMGSLVALTARGKSTEFNAKAEAEAAEAFRQIRENWKSYHPHA